MSDAHYEPPGPLRERETTAWCDTCESDQLGIDILWDFGAATRECYGCGDVTDIEGDE